MNLTPTVETFGSGNQSWLGSAHGADNAETVTLKGGAFEALRGAHGGVIPSGTPLKVNADGLFEPVAEADDKLAGFLFTDQKNSGLNEVAPMVWHGKIRVDRLPAGAFDVTTLTNENPAFTFRNTNGGA